MPNSNETKREVEVLADADNGEDTTVDATEGDDDELITPAVEDAEVNAALGKASATGAADTTNDTTASETTPDVAAATGTAPKEADVRSQHKLEGETDREYGLRMELNRIRDKQRDDAAAAITGRATPPTQQSQTDERMKKLQERYSPEEIQNMEEAIDVIASSRGYVKREESYQESANTVLNTFIETHKEYKPEYDKDDVRWGRFQEILTSDYNLQGKTPKQLEGIFNKVHRDVTGELGEVAVPDKKNAINAQKQKIQSVSHSGGNAGQTQSTGTKVTLDPEVRKRLKGFDDEDFL